MKERAFTIFCIAAIAVLSMQFKPVKATLFQPGDAHNTINLNLVSVTTSNKTGTAQFLESVSIHSIQCISICTNAVSNVISASLDGVSWSTILTNSASASSTNLYTFIGYRFGYLKSDFTQKTANGSTNFVVYLGGRQ